MIDLARIILGRWARGDDRDAAAFEALLSPLPAPVGRTLGAHAMPPLPGSPADVISAVKSRLVGAGIAQGRDGYSGGRDKPGWIDYVAHQRDHVAALKALVAAYGMPSDDTASMIGRYEARYPPPRRLLGDDATPHVDDVAGKLMLLLPVSSDTATESFAFEIDAGDPAILRAEPNRRELVFDAARRLLQASVRPGSAEVTPAQFRTLLDRFLRG